MRFDDIIPRDASQLAMWMGDVCPSILYIDGHIFLDRDRVGEKKLRAQIAKSESIQEAQYWSNTVPLGDFIDQFTTTQFDPDDPGSKRVLAICEDNWTVRVKAAFPEAKFKIVQWRDDVGGDYGLRLVNDENFRPSDLD